MTTDTKTSPFVPGARVAVRYGYHGDWREAFVDKVYKTRRFTLRGSSQQWRPTYQGGALETGTKGYSRGEVRIWSPEMDAAMDDAARRRRLGTLRDRIVRAPAELFTDAMLDAIEAALPKVKP